MATTKVATPTKIDISSLRGTLESLKGADDLLITDKEVDPHLELAGLSKHFDGGSAMLFEKVKGYPNGRLVTNVFACEERVSRLFGVRIEVRGRPVAGSGVLIAANHASWLDITVLSAVIPVSFVAKSEVARWPFFGTLARLQRTVFVERERRAKTHEHSNEIAARVAKGDAIILFPEGTSGDGNRVLKFNSSLFGAAEAESGAPEIPVQPLSVAYTKLHGLPMGREFRPFFAWYGAMEMASHLWNAILMGPIDVVLEFHEPLTISRCGSRKELARQAERLVSEGVARALTGRPPAPRVKDQPAMAAS